MKIFETEKRVIYYETDAMGIVHHSNYIRFFEIGRTEMLRQMGCPHWELEQRGIWIPVLDVTCQYKIPARYDDQLLIRCWIERMKGASVSIQYQITRKETGEVLVTGTSSHGFTDKALKPVRLKKAFPDIYAAMTQGLA